MQELVRRYRKIVSINREPGEWNRQRKYEVSQTRGNPSERTVSKGKFAYQDYRLTDKEVAEMLAHKYWLGTRALQNGIIYEIRFDIDATTAMGLALRDERYWAIRTLMGSHRIPLVYQTPSGLGLRVVYRIPRTPRSELITGEATGLVADVLRGHGLTVKKGSIEIFPQANQADRLPLGRRMPLLNPETLRPLPHANIGDRYDERMLAGALEEMERWRVREYPDLVAHLRDLPQIAREAVCGKANDDGSGIILLTRSPEGRVELSRHTRALILDGLPGPGSRYASEWKVGVALVLEPSAYPHLGLSPFPSHRAVASALARWLSLHHNGHSGEWTLSVQEGGSVEAAVADWTERYLERNSKTGDNLIDRLMRKVASLDPAMKRVFQLNPEERNWLLQLGERAPFSGAARYRFECWLFAWLSAVKRIIVYKSNRRGKPLPRYYDGARKTIVVEISAAWMSRWPFGNGTDTRGENEVSRYVVYRDILEQEGAMTWSHPYRSPTFTPRAKRDAPTAGTTFATRYKVDLPDLATTLRDVRVPPRRLRKILCDLPTVYGRTVTLAEAYHALEVTGRKDLNLRARYGDRTARRVRRLGDEIRHRLGVLDGVNAQASEHQVAPAVSEQNAA